MNIFKRRAVYLGWRFQELLVIALGIAFIIFLVSVVLLSRLKSFEDVRWSVLMRLLVNLLLKMGYRRELIYEILEIYC